MPLTAQIIRPLNRIKTGDKLYLWHSKITLKTHPPKTSRRILTNSSTESVGSFNIKYPAIILNITGKPHQSKLSLGRSYFENSSIPPSPKHFDIDPELLVSLLNPSHLGLQFTMRPDVSCNSIKGVLMHALPPVVQVPVSDIICHHADKLCLLSLMPTTNLPIVDILI